MQDKYKTIDNIEVYFDEFNERIKIVDSKEISTETLDKIKEYSIEKKVGKIISNCRSEDWEVFINNGFEIEGTIDGYFKGNSALCMSYFIDSERKVREEYEKKEDIIRESKLKKNSYKPLEELENYEIRSANEKDAKELSKLFEKIFSTYPTPVYDSDYIKETMKEKILYKVAVKDGEIVAVASADLDVKNLNAEITDCATNPDFESKGMVSNIIYQLEKELKKRGYKSLYSLARAINPGINAVFSKHNYIYNGRLVKNCNICGGFEDMNIWEKII